MELSPTDRELQALKILWEMREGTVREVWKKISASDGELPYTTVLSLLQVMEKKGLLDHRADGKTYFYFPRVDRQSVFRRLANGFLEKVFDGAVDQYLVHALDSRHSSREELDRLEKMIADAKAKTNRPRRKRGSK